MRSYRVWWILLFAVGLGAACNSNKFEKTGDGLLYRFIERKNGRRAAMGELLQLHLCYRDAKGKVLFDSKKLGTEFIVQVVPPTFIGGLEGGFAMMGEGDSAVFSIPADSVFEKTFHETLPPSVNKGDYLSFEVRLEKIMNPEEYRNRRDSVPKKVSEIELHSIEAYLAENSMNVQPSRPGVYAVELRKGNGAIPVPGDSVEIKYRGSFLSGEVFDSSKDKNLKYVLGDGLRLPAWEETIAAMKEGGMVRLVLSSDNAFGKDGFGPVPPATTVIYDIELIKVKKTAS